MDFYIRPIDIKDARDIHGLRCMEGVFENILGIPSEQLKKSENFISNIDNNHHQFVAVIKNKSGEEKVIGSAGLTVFQNRRRHSGAIGIMVHRDYQNNGVGSALMKSIVDMADNWLMIVRLELTVFEDNERAIHLYEKFGFRIEGTKLLATIRNGKYIDEIMMGRINPNLRI